MNPTIKVDTINRRLTPEDWAQLSPSLDVVVDATDSFQSRFELNEYCVRYKIPLVSGAAIRFEGQVTVFLPEDNNSPCYRCLYNGEGLDQTCSQTGVIAPLLGIIGSIQALETLKLLAGIGEVLVGKLLIFDAIQMEWQTMQFRKNPKCPVCGQSEA